MASPSAFEAAFQPPPGSSLQTYNLELSASSPLQASTIPQTLKNAFFVRENVFVNEQLVVPLQHHLDADEARSCHWVLYTNSDTGKIPIGAIRLLPPPQHPHPEPGARYDAPGADIPTADPKSLFSSSPPKQIVDKKSDMHDGIEPYVKLGRLCLLREYRGKQLADSLIQAALEWAKQKENRALASGGIEEWKGLVCLYARKEAVKTWARNGFVVDESMRSWFEVGIPHVAMFLRLDV